MGRFVLVINKLSEIFKYPLLPVAKVGKKCKKCQSYSDRWSGVGAAQNLFFASSLVLAENREIEISPFYRWQK
jgi:hypothetical protein